VNVAAFEHPAALSTAQRRTVLTAAFLCWLCAGLQMGLTQLCIPPALTSVFATQAGELTSASGGPELSKALIGFWFARNLAALQIGAAFGGVIFGRRADRHGRSQAMGLSVLCSALATGLAFFATTPVELVVSRFFCGLGIGGTWPTAVALAGEAWPGASKAKVAGLIGMAANVGILVVGETGRRLLHATPDTWRTWMLVGAIPAVLGLLTAWRLPESPAWLAQRGLQSAAQTVAAPLRELFRPALFRNTLIGIGLATVPLLGAWGSSKWIIPWASDVGRKVGDPSLAANVQSYWAYGAVLASATGGWLADQFGRRTTYFAFSLAALVGSLFVFARLDPSHAWFMPAVFVIGISGTLFFGWLPLYLPELFPTAVRATGIGLTYNAGRILTAVGIIVAGEIIHAMNDDYARVGTITSWVYLLGMIIILFAPPGGAKKN
jgi:SHS family sialic acid transporter-like MFS transporter